MGIRAIVLRAVFKGAAYKGSCKVVLSPELEGVVHTGEH
jgi:hypothetical protein